MKMDAFKTVQNVNIHLGYFGMKICHQEFYEIANLVTLGGVHFKVTYRRSPHGPKTT